MALRRLLSLLMLVALVCALGASQRVSAADKVTITWLTHWSDELTLKAEKAMIAEFEASHPDITIDLQTVDFGNLLTKITTSNAAGTNPDVYHIYNLWLPDFAKSKLLA